MRAAILVMLMAMAGGAEAQTTRAPYLPNCVMQEGQIVSAGPYGCTVGGGGGGSITPAEAQQESQAMCLRNGQWLFGACEAWRLILQTYADRIDIRKGLTQEQCEHDRLKALNQPADEEERAIAQRFHDEDTAAWDRARKICLPDKLISSCLATEYVAISPMRISSDIRRAICEKQP